MIPTIGKGTMKFQIEALNQVAINHDERLSIVEETAKARADHQLSMGKNAIAASEKVLDLEKRVGGLESINKYVGDAIKITSDDLARVEKRVAAIEALAARGADVEANLDALTTVTMTALEAAARDMTDIEAHLASVTQQVEGGNRKRRNLGRDLHRLTEIVTSSAMQNEVDAYGPESFSFELDGDKLAQVKGEETRQAKERFDQEIAREQASQAAPFKVGDVVRRKSGGFSALTVESLHKVVEWVDEWLFRAVGYPEWMFSCAHFDLTEPAPAKESTEFCAAAAPDAEKAKAAEEQAPFKPGDHVVGTRSGARYVVAETRKDPHWGWVFRHLASPHWHLCRYCELADRGVWTPWGFVPF